MARPQVSLPRRTWTARRRGRHRTSLTGGDGGQVRDRGRFRDRFRPRHPRRRRRRDAAGDGRRAVSQRRHRRATSPLRTRRSSCRPTGPSRIPDDYLRVLQAAVPAVDREAAACDPTDVIGIGIDFTACTMLPAHRRRHGALRKLPAFRSNPHAWVKLWKHHAAQPEADRINAVARATGQAWLDRYGGKISSEWFFSKALQILDEAPEVYAAADRLIEAADWVVWRLTGVETRNACTAGLQGDVVQARRLPRPEPTSGPWTRASPIVVDDEDAHATVRAAGERAGGLSAEAAAWTGLPVGNGGRRSRTSMPTSPFPPRPSPSPGAMVMIMGTSTCHMVLGPRRADGARHVRLRRGRDHPGLLRLRGRPVVRRRSLLVVRRAGPAGRLPRRGSRPRASTSTASSRRGPRASGSASRDSSRSTGGTATGRSWSTRSSAACSSG